MVMKSRITIAKRIIIIAKSHESNIGLNVYILLLKLVIIKMTLN